MSTTIQKEKDCFILRNQFFSRRLRLTGDGFFSDSLVNTETGTEYCGSRSLEFCFSINGTTVTSYMEGGVREVDGNTVFNRNFPRFQQSEILEHGPEEKELRLTFGLPAYSLTVTVSYRIFTGLPGWIKQLNFSAGDQELCLTNLIFDFFNFYPGKYTDCIHRKNGSREELAPCFSLEGECDTLSCWNPRLQEGFLCGTAAPGPLRRFLSYVHWGSREISYAKGAAPFCKYLAPEETFAADESLTLLMQDEKQGESAYRELLRKILPPAPPQGIMYCSWLPFLKNIDENLILTLSQKAADLGCRYFVLDDGWFSIPGRKVDKSKFPHGLSFLSEKIRGTGLKFGLWFNIGNSYGKPDTPDSRACLQADGSLKMTGPHKVLCWGHEKNRQAILKELTGLAEKYHVSYFKLDFSSIISPYAIQPWGCHSRRHSRHHGFADSIPAMYEGFAWLRTELKKRFPQLLIDFSFECFGPEKPSIAALKYSDLNHLSNFSGLEPELQSITKIRKTFYQWFSLLPPERLLGGLLTVMDYRPLEYLLTSFAGAPLISGNILTLSEKDNMTLEKCTGAFNQTADREILTELEIPVNEENLDCFIRKGKSGHGFLCAFNRSDKKAVLNLQLPFPAVNAVSGSPDLTVDADSCAMFVF